MRIPFEGEATNGKSFYGEVKLTYVTLSEPTIITYTSTGLAVDFNAADFTAACAARGGKALTSVRFPAPDTTGGQLYYNFHTPTQYRGEVVSSVDYSVGGVYLLGEVTFLPKAGYSGIVTIPYVGTDADGIEYTGTVQVMVTPSASSRFSDMGSYNSWAGASVEFLAAYGITTGTGDGATFSPASTLTRGDYILMLYRTFGFSSTAAAGNFTDVTAGSYYAEALAHAKALGIATAVRRNTVFDKAVQVVTIVGYSLPSFIIALLAIFAFAVKIPIFPISGVRTAGFEGNSFQMALDTLWHMALPVIVMSISGIGSITRYVRAAMIDVLRMDYIKTARSKGLREKVVIYVHAFRNALIPVVTIATAWVVSLFGGSIVIENVFLWPGLGQTLINGLMQRDFSVVLTMQMFYVVLSLAGNVIMDIAYTIVDPRVRLEN